MITIIINHSDIEVMFTNLAIPMGYHPALPETRRSWSETRVDVSTICPTKG